MLTDLGMGFRVSDDHAMDWSGGGAVSAGETRSGRDVWEAPAGAGIVSDVVNNWLAHPGVYRVELFKHVKDTSAN